MPRRKSRSNNDIQWIGDLRKHGPPLNFLHPVWVEERQLKAGEPTNPPHWHPYLEISLLVKGEVVMTIGNEKTTRHPHDLMIVGPSLPHSGVTTVFPFHYYVVYFQPWVIFDASPKEGIEILKHFSTGQTISDYITPLPPALYRHYLKLFKELAREVKEKSFGWELQIRAMVTTMIVDLMRNQLKADKKKAALLTTNDDWEFIQRALEIIHRDFAEPIYAPKLAASIGISKSRLQTLFKTLLGMPWVQYLQQYRIHRSIVILSNSSSTITEAAFAVGFESLSHFNSTFTAVTGINPSQYRKTTKNP